MSDDKRRETKPDLQKGKQTAVQPRKGTETAMDRRPTGQTVPPILERKG